MTRIYYLAILILYKKTKFVVGGIIMTQKNKVQLKICGANYTIVSEDEPEYVESLGELLMLK